MQLPRDVLQGLYGMYFKPQVQDLHSQVWFNIVILGLSASKVR